MTGSGSTAVTSMPPPATTVVAFPVPAPISIARTSGAVA